MMTVVADATVSIPTRLLVLGMAHHDGTIVADEVYPVAEACGQGPEQVRSCFRRLVAEGLFTREGEGRQARFRATAAGLITLGAHLERQRLAYAQDAAGRGWDRQWRLVAFAIPESKRTARDAFRDHLRVLGGAAIHNGLYVSPHRWEKDVRGRAEQLGVHEHVTLATTDSLDIGGEHDPRQLARHLWPLAELERRYQEFVDRYHDVPATLEDMRSHHQQLDDAAFLPGALAMGVAFESCFAIDPLLPPELLPRPWPGRAARELVVRSRRAALRIRQAHDRPALFQSFDDLLAQIP
jgi:phenylacetic acid degradation operon negative regulatory protein